jgi:RHH-type rel operon transcriptional repressor/antitoxin RelB
VAVIAVRLPKELQERLTTLAQKTGQSEGRLVRQALLAYLEDFEDHRLAEERLRSPLPGIPLEELERSIGDPPEL